MTRELDGAPRPARRSRFRGAEMKLIADLERGLAEREAAGLLRTRRIVESPPGPRVDVDGGTPRQLRQQRLPRTRPSPAGRRRGRRRRGALGRGRRGVAPDLRPPRGARGARGRARGVGRAVRRRAGADVLLRLPREPRDPVDARGARRRDLRRPPEPRLPERRRAAVARASFVRYPHGDVAHLADAARGHARARPRDRHRRRVQHGRRHRAAARAAGAGGSARRLARRRRRARLRRAGTRRGAGRGSLAHFGLASERIVYMGTLGKAAGVAGAFVAAHPAVIATLVQRRALVRVHDRGAAAARRGGLREPCADPRPTARATRTSRR